MQLGPLKMLLFCRQKKGRWRFGESVETLYLGNNKPDGAEQNARTDSVQVDLIHGFGLRMKPFDIAQDTCPIPAYREGSMEWEAKNRD